MIIWACIEADGRNKALIGIKSQTFSRSSRQRQRKQSHKLPTSYKSKAKGIPKLILDPKILRRFSVVSNSTKNDANGFLKVL